MVYEFVSSRVRGTKAAVLYEKPRSVIKPEFVWRRTDQWINFPWSSEEPIAAPASGSEAL